MSLFRSLRVRLLGGLILGSVAVAIGASTWLLHAIRLAETEEFDHNLIQKMMAYEQLAEFEAGAIDFETDQMDPRGVLNSDPEQEGGTFFEFFDASGRVLFHSGQLVDGPSPAPATPPAAPEASGPVLEDLSLDDGTTARSASAGFEVRVDESEPAGTAAPRLFVRAVERTEPVDELLDRVGWIVIGTAAVSLAIAVPLGFLLLGHSLRGLTPVRRQLDQLADGDLSRPVDPGSLPTEFLPLVGSINGLLADLNTRMARERRFVGDAAHELRTPMATILANLELALEQAPPHAARPAVERSLGVARAMQKLCARLLILARTQGNPTVEITEVDAAAFLEDQLDPLRPALAERGIGVEVRVDARGRLRTDPVLLGMILTNLIRNAAAHARAGSTATLELVHPAGDAGVLLRLSNETAEPLDARIASAGEPFWRGDRARNLDDDHAGLGLALVEAAAAALGGRLACRAEGPRRFVAEVRLGVATTPPTRLHNPFTVGSGR